MKNKLSKKTICLAAAAVVLVGTLSIGSALAYFSTYVLSGGQETLTLKFTETEVLEEKTWKIRLAENFTKKQDFM